MARLTKWERLGYWFLFAVVAGLLQAAVGGIIAALCGCLGNLMEMLADGSLFFFATTLTGATFYELRIRQRFPTGGGKVLFIGSCLVIFVFVLVTYTLVFLTRAQLMKPVLTTSVVLWSQGVCCMGATAIGYGGQRLLAA